MEAALLITGAAGMLGRRLVAAERHAVGATRADGDLAEEATVRTLFKSKGPFRGVIHAAGFTSVDRAEQEPERARRDNVETTRQLALACAAAQIPLLLISTDYVFDGRSDRPYRASDPPHPLNTYGETKLEAERVALSIHPNGALVVRTAWLYGPGFPDRILALAGERETLQVVADQRGSPTSVEALVPVLLSLMGSGARGIVHAACDGVASWCDLAKATLECKGLDPERVRPCTTADFPRPARRPAMSALDCPEVSMPHWREALVRYLARVS